MLNSKSFNKTEKRVFVDNIHDLGCMLKYLPNYDRTFIYYITMYYKFYVYLHYIGIYFK